MPRNGTIRHIMRISVGEGGGFLRFSADKVSKRQEHFLAEREERAHLRKIMRDAEKV
jgi:hypothetical protein